MAVTKNDNENLEPVEKQVPISFFFADKVEAPEVEIDRVISTRFKDGEGQVIPFRFKAISPDEIDEIDKTSQIPIRDAKNRKTGETKLDIQTYSRRIAIASCVYPNMKDAELLKSYKVTSPMSLIPKLLPIQGEVMAFIEAAFEVNGFGIDPEDMQKAAKN